MLHAASSQAWVPSATMVPREIRALLLDDNTFDRARIRRMTNRTDLSIHMDEVDSIHALDMAVAQENYDVILIDYRLPVGDGIEAVARVLSNEMNCRAGKIMITGDSAQDTAIAALRSGCHDFLIKDQIDASALRQAILNALCAVRPVSVSPPPVSIDRDMIREGVRAAMQDAEVRGNVISMIRQARFDDEKSAALDALLATLDHDDDFVFH